MKKVFKKIILGSCALLTVMMSGCGNSSTDYDEYVAIICKSQGAEFWEAAAKGAYDAGEEMNIKITFDAPDDESQIDAQISMINQAVSDGANAIVLAPLDTNKLNDALSAASEKGVQIVTIDSAVTFSGSKSCIATQNESAGAIAARQAYSLVGDSGKIAVIAHNETSSTAVERRGGFIDEILSESDNKVEIVGTEYCDGDKEKSKAAAKKFIEENPDINLIYATNEGGTVGVCQAIEELGLKDKIKVVGFDSSDDAIAYIRNGILNSIIVQNPYNMGYLGVRYCDKLINGKSISTQIDTGATLVTSDNIDDEDVQSLLYPMG